jgi:NADH-quinone oxidoreductase subunit G
VSDTAAPATVAITVNGVAVEAKPGELVIDACERNGVYIPRFCYHSRMRAVGMCRMCLVEIDGGRGPALQPSCMVSVTPDMKVFTESKVTKKAQDGILEFLLINHPLDCPVCDKGGECPLQDQTMAYGPGESRFVEEKRHFEKPIPISDLVYLDRERCILCDRCTRFAKEVAGDPLIHFQGRGNQTEVNTFPEDPFSSYFSGNTVQICPVGALTAKPYRFKARPWDLEEVESTSVVDSVGARIAVQSSRDRVLRFVGVDSDPVNWGWLSDKERFSFEALDHEGRLSEPLMRGNALGKVDPKGEQLVRATWAQALGVAAGALIDAGPSRVGVLGGARLTNEAAYAWAKLAKGVLGTDNVDAQLADGLPADLVLGLPRATIDDACTPGGVIVLLGPDPKEELGALYLRLRHAIIEDRATLIELTPRSTGLAKFAAHRLYPRPAEVGELAAALVADTAASRAVAGIEPAAITAAAAALRSGKPVTVILGRASLAEGTGAVVDAAIALRDGLPGVKFLSALRRGNVHGALDMGLAPGLLPGRTTLADNRAAFVEAWPNVPASAGLDATGILEAAAAGRITTLVLLGADPLRDFPDAALAKKALETVDTLIAVDLFVTDSGRLADVVLAAAASPEVDGSFTNLEGRVTAVRQKVTPPGTARSDWMIAAELAFRLGGDLGLESVEQIRAELASLSPIHEALATDAFGERDGVLITGGSVSVAPREPVATPKTDAYSFRLVATRSMYDLGTVLQHSPSSAHLAPGTAVLLHPADFDQLGVAAGARVKVFTPKASLHTIVQPDAGVPRGSAAMLFNQPDADVGALLDARAAAIDVRVERA